MFSDVFGFTKAFHSRWVGSHPLNRAGLHVARMLATDACLALRRTELAMLGRGIGLDDELGQLGRDGIVVVDNFLPDAVFRAARDQARAQIAALPPPPPPERGFGAKHPTPHGFDRYDGGTLNRFVALDHAPHVLDALHDNRLAALCTVASGFRYRPERFWIYQTVHGDDRANPDYQRRPHRDTFHSTFKAWLFLDDVPAHAGPLLYSPGSHRMTTRRLRWEHGKALAASAPEARERGGAFRVDAAGLRDMQLPALRPYPVAANTLVLADVRGFHARGQAAAGVTRLALYGNLRLWPFSPLAY